MRIFATVPVRGSDSKRIRQPRVTHVRIASRRHGFRRLERFIESIRDRRCLRLSWIDKTCIAVLVLFTLYFVPVLAPLFLK